MTTPQRQAVFERLLNTLAKKRAGDAGMSFVGTIRRLPPPALPGEAQGSVRYFVNVLPGGGQGPRLLEFGARAEAQLRRAEAWVSTGEGPAPHVPNKTVS